MDKALTAKSVQLPVCTPPFINYQTFSAAGMALAKNPTSYNQMLNQCTSLRCSKNFLRKHDSSPIVFPLRAAFSNFSLLERYPVSNWFAYPYLHAIIKQMLDENFYVHYSGVDDYYLPEKSWYGTRHLMHDGTITGYDESDMTYTIVAFDINWVYRAMRIPQEAFQRGMDSAFENRVYGCLNAIRAKEDRVDLDPPMIVNYLKGYLNSDLKLYPPETDGTAHGIVVHDYIAMYMNMLADGTIPYEKMDWRVLRPLWEFKRCMLDRIAALEKRFELGSELSDAYRPTVEATDRYRMMFALYHKKKKDWIPKSIAEGIPGLKETEFSVLTKLIEKTGDCLKK